MKFLRSWRNYYLAKQVGRMKTELQTTTSELQIKTLELKTKTAELKIKNTELEIKTTMLESMKLNEASLVSLVTQLQTEKYNLQQHNDQLQLNVGRLQEDINKLRQENYELQGHSSNMIVEFPTVEKVLNAYSNFGQQRMVGFISQFEDSGDSVEEFTTFIAATINKVHWVIKLQYSTIVYPLCLEGSMSPELLAHLQHNYQHIMSLETWCKRFNSTIGDYFMPRDSPFHEVQGLLK